MFWNKEFIRQVCKTPEGICDQRAGVQFEKFPGVSKELGPEMKSTGEAIHFIKDLRDPYFRQLYKEKHVLK